MKHLVKKFRDGLIIGAGILTMLGIGTFAYSTISNVSPNETLTATKFNEMVTAINELQEEKQGQNQNAFDTNEIWTGKYDALTGKKIYSKWVYFGNLPSSSGISINHNIENVSKIINFEGIILNTSGTVYNIRPTIGLAVSPEQIIIRTWEGRGGYTSWFRIEYTKTTD